MIVFLRLTWLVRLLLVRVFLLMLRLTWLLMLSVMLVAIRR